MLFMCVDICQDAVDIRVAALVGMEVDGASAAVPSLPKAAASPAFGKAKKTLKKPTGPPKRRVSKRAEERRAARETAKEKKPKRLWADEIPECPIYRPTAEQFKNPLTFIESIRCVAVQQSVLSCSPCLALSEMKQRSMVFARLFPLNRGVRSLQLMRR